MAPTIEIEQAGKAESEQVTAGNIAVAQIEDPRDHAPEIQDRLRHLLASGATVRPDPKRADVFEIEDDEHIFYVHAAKASGKVTLLAVWERDVEDSTAT